MTQEEYIVVLCAEIALGKLRLTQGWIWQGKVKNNKKGFKYIGSRRKMRKNVGSLLNGAGDLVPYYRQKAEVLKCLRWLSLCQQHQPSVDPGPWDTSREVWNKADLLVVEEDQVRERFSKPSTCELGPDGLNSRVQREPTVTARPLTVTLGRP